MLALPVSEIGNIFWTPNKHLTKYFRKLITPSLQWQGQFCTCISYEESRSKVWYVKLIKIMLLRKVNYNKTAEPTFLSSTRVN